MHGDSAPESAPLLLPYGKALVEIAIENQGVLGKEEPEKENEEGPEEGE
jgi:HAT1-interacting factor 1